VSHDYHEGHANYNKFQLYFDGCTECEIRSSHPVWAIEYLRDFKAAWMRAIRFEQSMLHPDEMPISEAEAPVLRMLWALVVQFERIGYPIGIFPGDVTQVAIGFGRSERRYF